MFSKSLFALILLSVSLVFGAENGTEWPQPLQKLLQLARRPTILEFEQALMESYGGLPPKNTFQGNGGFGRPTTEQDYIDLLSDVEMLFPGGTYFVMGRDANHYGDALEYFYTRILKQEGRVRLLDVSNPSFFAYPMGEERTQRVLSAFLKTSGVDISVEKTFPDVLTDVTSYSPTSQTTRLMVTLFKEAQNLGLSPEETLKRVNFLGVDLARRDPIPTRRSQVEQLAAEQLQKFKVRGPEGYRPLYLETNMSYGATWHAMFTGFETTAEGTFGVRGKDGDYRDKMGIFREMLATLYVLQDPKIVEKVQEASREKGFEYPLTRSATLVKVKELAQAKPMKSGRYESYESSPSPATSFRPSNEDTDAAALKSFKAEIERLIESNKFHPVNYKRAVERLQGHVELMKSNPNFSDALVGKFQQALTEKIQQVEKQKRIKSYADKRVGTFAEIVREDVAELAGEALKRRLQFWRDDVGDMLRSGSLSQDQHDQLMNVFTKFETEKKSPQVKPEVLDPAPAAIQNAIENDPVVVLEIESLKKQFKNLSRRNRLDQNVSLAMLYTHQKKSGKLTELQHQALLDFLRYYPTSKYTPPPRTNTTLVNRITMELGSTSPEHLSWATKAWIRQIDQLKEKGELSQDAHQGLLNFIQSYSPQAVSCKNVAK